MMKIIIIHLTKSAVSVIREIKRGATKTQIKEEISNKPGNKIYLEIKTKAINKNKGPNIKCEIQNSKVTSCNKTKKKSTLLNTSVSVPGEDITRERIQTKVCYSWKWT
jgi:hypothetical protein